MSKTRFHLVSLAAALALLVLACQTTLFTDWVVQPGDVLFKDDFSDVSSGWQRSADPGGAMDYFSNTYRITVNIPNYDYWSPIGLVLADVRIEVDAAKIGGPDENRLGVICRYLDPSNYYFFIISSDGYYGVGKVKDGRSTLLGQDMMAYSAVIVQGMEINHLRADCAGSTLSFYVNGFPIAQVQDADFISGDVGLLAGAFDQTGVDVVFDNFVVLKP